MKLFKRHKCPPGIRLTLINGGEMLINLTSEEAAYIAKYGGDETQKVDLLQSIRIDPYELLELVVSYEA